jgi:hypothetical protein
MYNGRKTAFGASGVRVFLVSLVSPKRLALFCRVPSACTFVGILPNTIGHRSHASENPVRRSRKRPLKTQ